jgi:hypothetical protein
MLPAPQEEDFTLASARQKQRCYISKLLSALISHAPIVTGIYNIFSGAQPRVARESPRDEPEPMRADRRSAAPF